MNSINSFILSQNENVKSFAQKKASDRNFPCQKPFFAIYVFDFSIFSTIYAIVCTPFLSTSGIMPMSVLMFMPVPMSMLVLVVTGMFMLLTLRELSGLRIRLSPPAMRR